MRSRHRHARVLLRSNIYNLRVIDSLHDDQQVEVQLTVCCLNAQSLRNKAISVADYVVSKGIGVLALTETWLVTDTDRLTINKLVPGGYEFNHIPRKGGRRGGGIGLLYRSGLTVTVSKSETTEMYTHFENMDCIINIGTVTCKFCIIYRPLLLNKIALEIQFSLTNGLNT